MSRPLTDHELDKIAEEVMKDCDSADEGIATMTFVRSIDPDEARKMYNLG